MDAIKIGFYVITGILVLISIGLTVSWFSTTCAVESCKTVVDRMSYAEAIDRLEELLEEKPENQKLFIKNFLTQLRGVCVARAPTE